MGYYMSGGYYRAGGYYRGGFFSKVGKVLGKVAGAASKLAPVATIVNPGLGMAMGSIGGVGQSLFAGQAKTSSPGVTGPNIVTLTGGKGGLTLPPLEGFGIETGPQLYNRFPKLAGGGPGGGAMMASHQAGAIIYPGKRRTMNPLNPRALRRAYRRLTGAERWAHRLFSVSKPRHGVKPKFGRKRRS